MVKRVIFLAFALTGTFLAFYLSTNGSGGYSSFGNSVGEWINEAIFSSNLTKAEVSALSAFGGKGFGHVLLYLLTGLFYDLFLRTLKNLKYEKAILMGIGLVIAAGGELTQLFVASRHATFMDVIINFSSFMSVPTIGALLRRTN